MQKYILNFPRSVNATPSWKKLKFNVLLPSVLWQFPVPCDSPFHKKELNSVRMFFCVAHLSKSLFTSNVRCYWQNPAPFSSAFHRKDRKKVWEKSFILGFWMNLGISLQKEEVLEASTSIKIVTLYNEGQTETGKEGHWASLPWVLLTNSQTDFLDETTGLLCDLQQNYTVWVVLGVGA